MSTQPPIPSFELPPVIEVALSAQFEPIKGWDEHCLGLMFVELENRFPEFKAQTPLAHMVEVFGADEWKPPQGLIMTQGLPTHRGWFVGGQYLIQAQRDRFVFNWRKITEGDVYPRYEATMRPKFAEYWSWFEDFVARRRLGEISVDQAELTYVNEIPQDSGSLINLRNVIAAWNPSYTDGFLGAATLDDVDVGAAYLAPDLQGRLHVKLRQARRPDEKTIVLRLSLTARGMPTSTNIIEWFDNARAWIVRGFADWTTPQAQDQWRRER